MTSPDSGGPTVRIGAAEWRTRVRDHDPDLYRGAPLSVALMVSTFMNRNGSGAYPSIDTLARLTKRSRATVISALKTLEADGFLVKQFGRGMRGGSRGPKTTRYLATIPTVNQHETGASGDTSSLKQVSLGKKQVSLQSETGVSGDTQPVQDQYIDQQQFTKKTAIEAAPHLWRQAEQEIARRVPKPRNPEKVALLRFADLYEEDQRQRQTEEDRRAEEDRQNDADATQEAEWEASVAACGFCDKRGLVLDDTVPMGRRGCDHPDTSSGDGGDNADHYALDPTEVSEPARTLISASDGADTAETIEQGRLLEKTSTIPQHDTPMIDTDPEESELVPLGSAIEGKLAHATQLTVEKEERK